MNDEISVAELLVREGWGDRPPDARSRWRVVAVMLAVVIGCGAAAVLVAFSGHVRQDAEPVNRIQVIPMPNRTTGLGGADQATDSPSDGGVGGGTGGDEHGTATGTGHAGTVTEVPGRPDPTASATATPTTGTSTGAPSSSQDPTGTTATPTSPRSSAPTPPPTTTPTRQCTVWILICLG